MPQADSRQGQTIALVGGETLLGREVRDVFSSSGIAARLRLIGAGEDSAATLAEQDGEPVVVSALDEENLIGADLVILAGSPETSRKAYALIARRSPRPAVIDLTGGLEQRPGARLRAPMVEPAGHPAAGADTVHVIAHPAAVALALLLRRIPARRAVVEILAPVSEYGQRGVDELQRQVISLLSFKPLETELFDAQVAFNLLARYGAEAREKLESVSARIGSHLAALGCSPSPSIHLVQAPVFHGYGFSLWLEFDRPQDLAEFAATIHSPGIEVRAPGETAPDNVAVAGQSGVLVGVIESDRQCREALWLWAAADNLRMAAGNAVAVARQLLEGRAA